LRKFCPLRYRKPPGQQTGLYAPNVSAPNFIKHTLKHLKPHTDSSKVVLGDNTSLSPTERSSKQKLNKEILELNNTINQMDLTDINRIFHPKVAQYTFFSAVDGTFSLNTQSKPQKYKNTEITPCILSNHNALKLELNSKSNSRKYTNNLRLNNTCLNDQLVIEEIREEIRRFLEADENENTTHQNLWDTANAVLRGEFIAMSAHIKRTERSQIKDLVLHFKLLGKQEQARPKTSKRREIIKIRAKINELKTKKPYKESMKQKAGFLKK
jgi:hypothetical protein